MRKFCSLRARNSSTYLMKLPMHAMVPYPSFLHKVAADMMLIYLR